MSRYSIPARTKHVVYACIALLEFGAHDTHSSRNKRDKQVQFLLTELYKELCQDRSDEVFHGILEEMPAPPQVEMLFDEVLRK